MTVSELFRGLLTAFSFLFFLIFLHARRKSEFCSISEWLTLKAVTRISGHGVKTRISVEQREKALVFKKNRSSSPLEIARKCQLSKVNCE